MKRPIAAAGLTTVLFVAVAAAAHALWAVIELSPGQLEGSLRRFTVSTKPDDRTAGKLTTYTVTMQPTPQGPAVAATTSAELLLTDAQHDTPLASVPVATEVQGGKATFRFRVSPAATATSRLDIRDPNRPDILHRLPLKGF